MGNPHTLHQTHVNAQFAAHASDLYFCIRGSLLCSTLQELMIRYLDYFVKCGFLDSPVSSDILPSAFSAGGGLGEVGNLDGFVDEEDESFLVGGEMEC